MRYGREWASKLLVWALAGGGMYAISQANNPRLDNQLLAWIVLIAVAAIATVDMTVSGAIGAWANFATGLPAPTRNLYWQGWSMTSAQSYKLRLDTTGALGVRTNGDAYIDTTLTYIAAD